MHTSLKKKLLFGTLLCAMIIIAQTFAQQTNVHEEKATNLKVLSKKMSDDELHAVMRSYAKGLGVKCKFCHAEKKDDPKKLDFASDEKPEKTTARKMIKMTDAINKKFLDKIGNHQFEKISCVTCHNGNIKPMASADSLPKKKD